MSTGDRPIRVVRARDLVKGATVVRECTSTANCLVAADRHMTLAEPVNHCLTLLDTETHDGFVTAICVSESGEQCALQEVEWQMVRVFADSVPARAEQ